MVLSMRTASSSAVGSRPVSRVYSVRSRATSSAVTTIGAAAYPCATAENGAGPYTSRNTTAPPTRKWRSGARSPCMLRMVAQSVHCGERAAAELPERRRGHVGGAPAERDLDEMINAIGVGQCELRGAEPEGDAAGTPLLQHEGADAADRAPPVVPDKPAGARLSERSSRNRDPVDVV